MTEWKLAPVEPTFEMLRPWEDDDHIRFGVYVNMLSAAPKASEDEALKRKLQDCIADCIGSYVGPDRNMDAAIARAVLKMMEGER